jgi:hypothetical protein
VLTATPASPDRAPSQDARPTPQERKSAGKALRAAVPLDAHAESPGTTRSRDPLTLLEEQAVDRLPELRPIRYGRMLQSPSPTTGAPPGSWPPTSPTRRGPA